MIKYATREDILTARDVAYNASALSVLDRAIASASQAAENYPLRKYHPTFNATAFYDWPQSRIDGYCDLWVDDVDILEIATLTVAGDVVPPTDYWLNPSNLGPPYNRVTIRDTSTTGSFRSGGSTQRAIQIDGTFGYTDEIMPVGVLATDLADTTTTTVITDTAVPDVGNLLVIDGEWMNVTGRGWLDSGESITPAVTSQQSDNVITVSSVGDVAVNEIIRVDAELMLVTDTTATELVVERAYRGSVLAGHNGSTAVYRRNSYIVERAAVGSTASIHAGGPAVSMWVIPPLIQALVIAEAQTQAEQEHTAYARTIGQGESTREARGAGLAGLRRRVVDQFGRCIVARSI